jgi:metal-responsive CopG/Arc/MetJ family transcriptional regulator
VKTAISLPDALFEEADRLAKKRGISRSELYAHALEEHLAKTRSAEIRESYDRVYGAEETDEDRALARAVERAALETFRRNPW